jgi:hypothetical protein
MSEICCASGRLLPRARVAGKTRLEHCRGEGRKNPHSLLMLHLYFFSRWADYIALLTTNLIVAHCVSLHAKAVDEMVEDGIVFDRRRSRLGVRNSEDNELVTYHEVRQV